MEPITRMIARYVKWTLCNKRPNFTKNGSARPLGTIFGKTHNSARLLHNAQSRATSPVALTRNFAARFFALSLAYFRSRDLRSRNFAEISGPPGVTLKWRHVETIAFREGALTKGRNLSGATSYSAYF